MKSTDKQRIERQIAMINTHGRSLTFDGDDVWKGNSKITYGFGGNGTQIIRYLQGVLDVLGQEV